MSANTHNVSAIALFALLGLYLPHVELQLLAFEYVAITSATLAWS